MVQSWEFIDSCGAFKLCDPQKSSYLYFPLVNEAGMMSAVTPLLNGDVKAGQHSFLTLPTSVEDLHNSRSARNFWIHVEGFGAWSATGNSAAQVSKNFSGEEEDEVTLKAGFLWQQIVRKNLKIGLQAEVTSFVPASKDQVELISVRITNISNYSIQFSPTAAIPIYGRSADNLRDHRHVTSLLHRITCGQFGVHVRPTLTFDERGHNPNQKTYAVLGMEADGTPPRGFFPLVEDFIGEGGSLDWPEAVVRPINACVYAGQTFEGYEAMGGLRFRDICLTPGQSCSYVLLLTIASDEQDIEHILTTYGSQDQFDRWVEKTKDYWQRKLDELSFHTGDPQFNLWLKWVTIQPVLRRLFGNSFLPYHDYGRGGRGWRDLWQDILAALIIEKESVDHLLLGNFAGARMDGSNATIIGSNPGEFKADRNNIPRVWMDHGAWPLLTARLYIDQTGDLAFLLREQVYYKDHLIHRAQAVDADWEPSQGTQQRTRQGDVYRGTVLEHLLVQHLTAFFNVGEHNHIRLEGADWNDGMDMAAQRGESVAFTALYAGNLAQLSQLVQELQKSGIEKVQIASELLFLLDTLQSKINYDNVEAKQQRMKEYFTAVSHVLSGETVTVRLSDLAADLSSKADWLFAHIRAREWITCREGYSWFNGYYDNDGHRLEGDHPKGVRMTLTGQVFTLMSGIASNEQAEQMIQSVDHYLFDASLGGCRLNTDFKDVLMNMGRSFGFAYGHKENGAVFSHMAVMYAYALYIRGYALQAHRVLNCIYRQSINFKTSRIYPGIPEYFTPRGRGVYPYLTGSVSWYIFTLLTQVFGIRAEMGDLVLNPKLVLDQFDAQSEASALTRFAGRRIRVVYQNPERLEYGSYQIKNVSLDDQELSVNSAAEGVRIPRRRIAGLDLDRIHKVTVLLGQKSSGQSI